MKISVIGLGYVGLGVVVTFLKLGHEVNAIDIDEARINRLKSGELYFNEPGVLDVLKDNSRNVSYNTNYSKITISDITFLCINTPENKDWSVDTSMLDNCINSLKGKLKRDSILVIKSTVPVGYTKNIQAQLNDVHVAFIPEFLRQGHIYEDSLNPSRIVIGVEDDTTKVILKKLYSSFTCPVIFTNFASAELSKYASNNFLATKISFINQVANFANEVGANIEDVRDIMELDPRIGKGSLNPGVGFGGGCFVKDTKALYKQSLEANQPMTILKEVIEQNEHQKYILLNELSNLFSGLEYLKNNKILFVGISFKADSSDLRNSIALDNLRVLSRFTNNIYLYDKEVSKESKQKMDYTFVENLEEGVKLCDILLIFVEKKEINDLENSLFDDKIVLDGRNVLTTEKIKKCKYYYSIGKGNFKKV